MGEPRLPHRRLRQRESIDHAPWADAGAKNRKNKKEKEER